MVLERRIRKLTEGYSEGVYKGQKYGITKTTFNNGNSFKVYAEALAGNDFISFNYYVTKSKSMVKPCEMPNQKVIDFIWGVTFI